MPLVEAGHECGSEHGNIRPAPRPFRIAECGQGLTPRAKKKDAQQAIAEDVASFAKQEVQGLEMLQVHAEQKMQQGIEDTARVVGGEERARLNGNDDQPQDCGGPGLEKMVTVGAQARSGPVGNEEYAGEETFRG